ncbi:hypothetical protein A3J90_07795 [candidate division WOR-1 bacterium RIFOXYC2_FULL_37_10]|uniref:PorV/PorQ family protein n=1 Tax=candidate division WOR-1 bacterium RIFOXYB2_FULL_37_13 TaxID=1802579 RepID=A0A1F4SE01_UNCSA|nr:MAG: hypothetical protein A2246_04140 [candidate division WOR-1 bacterium RIFOXYA2_FULL_37_7]OGC18652.1 MAG: hypothetical protein A2310_03405 [candidate division WOR-1 bacterium RIFOXYB2_FULL_37_13]OGC32435.1 MAG: hypothetical protein A3J90_07795 [candidate division WOR-1 bacterium RIFOXYC2_FULL_37_10]
MRVNNIKTLKSFIKSMFCLLFFMAIFSCMSFSEIIDPTALGFGARSIGMGRSGLAATKDINSIFINPANGSGIKNLGITSMSTSLMEGDVNYTFFGGVKKLFGGEVGIAYLQGYSGGILSTTKEANGRVVSTGNSFDYSNSTLILSYAKEFNPYVSGGLSIKYFNKKFTTQALGSGFDADMGALCKISDKLALGMLIENFMPEGIGGIIWDNGTVEDLEAKIKSGFNYKLKDNIDLNVDLGLSGFSLNVGMEWRICKLLSLRGGFESIPFDPSSTIINATLGIGINISNFNFDCSYVKDGSLDANSTYFFSLSYLP